MKPFCIVMLTITVAMQWTNSLSAEPLRTRIEQHVSAVWKKQKVAPAEPASDAAFLRRLYLDLCGTIPTADQAKEFLDDRSADKRARLIERLLNDPRYAAHQAEVWDMIYFGRSPPHPDARKRRGFRRWLTSQFAANTPYDQIAEKILKAEGNTAEQGAPMYLAQFKDKPEDAAESVTQVFLGVQLQCARCHDHPFENWSQLDFYGMAAFLARLEVVDLGKKKDDQKMLVVGEKSGGDIEFTGPVTEEEIGKKGKPVAPKFLLASKLAEPELPKDFEEPRRFPSGKMPPKPKSSRKDALADWIISRDNPYFARALANRIWGQLMGRGLVHPIDNMSEGNAPSHPELLKVLADELTEHNFDVKWFIREIVSSKAYQLSSTGSVEAELPLWFERARVRPLSAEELVDSWRVVTQYANVDSKLKAALDKGDRFYPIASGYQLGFFGAPTDGVGNFVGGIHEHLFLSNGGLSKLLSTSDGGTVKQLAEAKESWPQKVETLYLTVLSRRPSDEEKEHFVTYLNEKERPHDRVKEAIWALMTSSEFRFNH